MTHDPLCLYVGDGPCRLCFRLETARAEARADERERIAQEIEAQHDPNRYDLCSDGGFVVCTHEEDARIARGGESDG